jgi:hypothetical protein
MTFTIHASKDGHLVQTLRLKPQAAVCSLNKAGWEVHITNAQGASFSPQCSVNSCSPETMQASHQTAQRLWLCQTTQPNLRCSVERNFFTASHPERMRRACG